jgi:hypothetical protein
MKYGRQMLPIAALLFFVAACGSDSIEPVPVEDAELNDFAVGVEGDQAGLPGLMLSSHGLPGTQGCSFNAASGRVECPPVTRGGLTVTKSFQLLDAAGVPQSQRGPNVVSVNTQLSVTGTIARDNGQLSVNRNSDLTVAGFGASSTELTHNGTEQGTITGTFTRPDVGQVNTSESFTHTSSNVVIPKRAPGARAQLFPLSGTSTRSVEFSRTAGGETHTFSYSEVITFNGTAIVPVVVTRNGETKNCTRNLLLRRLRCESD